ncbi:MAG: hypothetical protein JST35_10935 [Armatimonadetes bacterium]|nr:hypothetical protein [Armatimonadota bacterium]
MLTPYDWQEGIGHRASFIEARLEQGTPIIARSIDAGILVATFRRRANKIYEVYDHLVMASIGQQSDVEAIRVAAIDFAHQEGFNRSEQDVTVSRVVNALSTSLKRAFSDFQASPVVARTVFAEAGDTVDADRYFILDYDGDYTVHQRVVVVSGSLDLADRLLEGARALPTTESIDEAKASTLALLQTTIEQFEFEDEFSFEAVLLDRRSDRENRYVVLSRAD